ISGRLATASELASLSHHLVDISSQHEYQTLADLGTHLEYLDAYGGFVDERRKMTDAYVRLADALRNLADAQKRQADPQNREDFLRFQIQEIDAVEFRPGEDEELLRERDRLRHAERLARVTAEAEDTLYARDEAIVSVLARMAGEVLAA